MSDKMIRLSLTVENTYGDGTITKNYSELVTRPDDITDLDEWFEEEIFQFTGTGPERANQYAVYEVEITACDELPELIGKTYGWGG